jgi:hypothetical protein
MGNTLSSEEHQGERIITCMRHHTDMVHYLKDGNEQVRVGWDEIHCKWERDSTNIKKETVPPVIICIRARECPIAISRQELRL